jgi:predicted esterase
VAKLSVADQEFIKQQTKAVAAATGWIHDFPIATPLYPEAKQYLSGKNAKAVYQAFDKGLFPEIWNTNKKDAKAEFAYDKAAAKTRVYVPADYDGTKPFGVYLHISPGDEGENVEEYAAVMDRHKLIYISPFGTSNDQPMLRRVKLAVDAFSSVRAKYKVDPKRVCVGGFSGGGHMCMLTHAMFPDLFIASISHAAQSYLPAENTCGHFPGLAAGDLKNGPLRDHKWCVISGEKDQNYQEILSSSKLWEKGRYQYRFINVPGMAHTNAPADSLEEALKWVGL